MGGAGVVDHLEKSEYYEYNKIQNSQIRKAVIDFNPRMELVRLNPINFLTACSVSDSVKSREKGEIVSTITLVGGRRDGCL